MTNLNLALQDPSKVSFFIPKGYVKDANDIGLWEDDERPQRFDPSKEEDHERVGGSIEVIFFRTQVQRDAFMLGFKFGGPSDDLSGVAVTLTKPVFDGFPFAQIIHDCEGESGPRVYLCEQTE